MHVNTFDVLVIGAGPIGASAARHLALETPSVALIGPAEPTSHQDFDGPWGGWHDEGRLSHTIDLPLLSGLIGLRARRRFAALQEETAITFAKPVPGVTVAPMAMPAGALDGSDFFSVPALLSRAQDLGVAAEFCDEASLRRAFPSMRFAAGHVGVLQPDALLINPRALVRAEVQAAVRAGATRIVDEVRSIRRSDGSLHVTTRTGDVYRANSIVLAAGAHTNLSGLLPRPLAFDTYGATVALAEVDPSTVPFPTTMYLKMTDEAPYAGIIAPPLPYPDGHWYIKGSGSGLFNSPLRTEAEAAAWVKGGGDTAEAEALAPVLAELLPGVSVKRIIVRPCLVTQNDEDRAYLGFADEGLIVASEGTHGVTMADEFGRLAARLAIDGRWTDTLPPEPFEPRYR